MTAIAVQLNKSSIKLSAIFAKMVCLWAVFFSLHGHGQNCSSFGFSATDTSACSNQIITFRASNIPVLTRYTWLLGVDTIIGTDIDTVSTAYLDTGSFDIQLLLTLNNGTKCTLSRKDYINIGPRPETPAINFNKKNLCNVNEEVRLTTDKSNYASYTWNVGQILYKDSTDRVTHKFIRTGYFDVSLSVENKFGCSNTNNIDSLILVERAPRVDLNVGDTAFCDTQTVFLKPNFNLFNQRGFSYSWVFSGANVTGTSKKFPDKLLFSERGTHPFALNIISSGGCKYSYTFEDTIRIGKSVEIDINKKRTAPCNEQEISFDVVNKDDLFNELTWNFSGDSVEIEAQDYSAKVSYKIPGTYNYQVSHRDLGCVSELNDTVLVKTVDFQARFGLNKECSCDPRDTFQLINNSTNITAQSQFQWQVINSQNQVVFTDNARAPEAIINGYGEYDVQLTITDENGCTDSLKKFNLISVDEPELRVTANPKKACVGSDIVFGVDSICETNFRSAVWEFYDSDGQLVKSASSEMPVMNFASEGFYDVKLIYNTDKCSDTVYQEKVFEVVNLEEINYSLTDTTPCQGTAITGKLLLKPEGIAGAVSWSLTHVNNNSTVQGKPISGKPGEFLLKLNNTGIYDMKIVVNGGNGCIDSMEKKSLVKVSGLNAQIVAQSSTGCLPFKTRLRADVTKNVHYDNPRDNSLNYNWQITPNNGVTFDRPNSASTNISIQQTGDYNVFLNVENSDGCGTNVLAEDLFQFDFEAAFSLDSVLCQGIEYQATNNTIGNNSSYKWFSPNANITFHTDSTNRQAVFSFDTAGKQRIGLIAEAPSGCIDTTVIDVNIEPFNFDFSVANNSPRCTPAQYIFNIEQNNVDTFIWIFGDGDKVVTDQLSIAHVYDLSNIKPFRNEFDVRLVAQNNIGCKDTLEYEELIRVLGPNPTFAIKNNLGCEPYEVEFIDSTEQVERFYFNYDDGSTVDSVDFSSKVYSKKDSNQLFEVFKPFIIASDKNDCFVYYQPDDSIIVYANPKARFWSNTQKGCSPEAIDFNSNSKFASQHYWDFKNEGQYKNDSLSTRFTYSTGTYSVKLKVENEIGCADSLLKTRYIRVTEPPMASFDASDTIICPGRPIDFRNQSSATYPLTQHKWIFEKANGADTVNTFEFKRTYGQTGKFDVALIVQDNQNCTDTSFKDTFITIVDRLPIIDPELFFITVEDNDGISIRWNKLMKLGFEELHIVKNQDFENPEEIIYNHQTFDSYLEEPLVNSEQVSYQLKLIDRCLDERRISEEHKTIYLDVWREDKPFAVLEWTNYQGWEEIEEYVVYRKEAGGDFEELSRINYPDSSFIDYSVCDQEYTYLIGSVNPRSGNITYSNAVLFNPFYNAPKDEVRIELVTVQNDEISVQWSNNDNLNVKNFYVDRYDEFSGWKEGYYETKDTFFIDNAVEIDRLSYKYRVWYRDFCNSRNPPSNEGHSILLLGNISNQDFIYEWNGYQEWENGVANYIIEKSQRADRDFEDAAIFDNMARKMIDNKKAIRSDSAFYVRVKAIENAAFPDTSYSNIIKVYPEPVVHIPNAFSPNDDNVNDELSFDGLGFRRDEYDDFSLRIYNRWGAEVFRTEQYGDFWDGTFKGEKCADGVYQYFLQLRGVNNTTYSYKGNVLLFR